MISVLSKKELPKQIRTARLVLRKHTTALAPIIFEAVERDRAHLGRFLPWVGTTRKLEDEANYIKNAIVQWEKCESFDFGIFEGETGRFVGNTSVHSISWHNQRAELGYWLLSEFEGRGYMTEAADALTQATFALGFHRLEIRCDAENVRSAGVPKRLGYRLEATLEDEAVVNGAFRDTLVFSMLRSRYVPRM